MFLDEIVQIIRGLKTMLERSGTINKSRRSKHAGWYDFYYAQCIGFYAQ